MKKALNWLNVNFEPLCMLILFFAMLLLITVEVVLRMLFKSGLSWSEEMSRYLFVWLIFFSVSYATHNNRHLRVMILLNKMPGPVRRISMLVSDLLFLAFSAALFLGALGVCRYNARVGNMAITLPVSINILYLAGTVGFALMALRNMQNIVWKLRHWKDSLEVFENYNGEHYRDNRVCFLPEQPQEELEEGL